MSTKLNAVELTSTKLDAIVGGAGVGAPSSGRNPFDDIARALSDIDLTPRSKNLKPAGPRQAKGNEG